jgi:hypothetical protein
LEVKITRKDSPKRKIQMDTWLKCRIAQGQFSEEFVVEGKDAKNVPFSLFARDAEVDIDGWIRVEIIAKTGELCLVRLPQQTLENGSTVTVRCKDLQDLPARQEA